MNNKLFLTSFISIMLISAFVFIMYGCLSKPKTVQIDAAVRLSSIGYFPDAEKKASIAAHCTKFLVKKKSGNVVFKGKVSGPVNCPETTETIYIADFTTVNDPGEYYIDVPGVGRSFDFTIQDDVYNVPYKTAMLGMYLWRCGTRVEAVYNNNTYKHEACHLKDGYLDFITEKGDKKDGTKGWHDAGDYNKYTVNAGISVGVMLKAWEHFSDKIKSIALEVPENNNNLPDYLDEIKWELDWLLTMPYPDGSGRVSHKLSAKTFCGFIKPEYDIQSRYFTPWGSSATADFVAVMAQASRIYAEFDPGFAEVCLKAAETSYAFLKTNPGNQSADLKGFSTGEYQTQDPDDRLWAAAEMWETTGNAEYLADLEERIRQINGRVSLNWDWGNVENLGLVTYLLSSRQGKDTVLADLVRTELLKTADGIVGVKNTNAYARPLGNRYYWGCNGTVARQAVILETAFRMNPKPEYRATILDAVNHLFGRNQYCRSFVTGIGYKPPLHPHDRRSQSDIVIDPWPGYLVGGGQSATDWVDNLDSYTTNEIAINWNAALIYALAAFIKL